MRNLKYLFPFIVIFLISGTKNYSQSDTQGSLELKFKILQSKEEENSKVKFIIFENGKEIKEIESDQNLISLDLNKTYILKVSYSKMNKYIIVNTNVPDKKKDQLYKYTCKLRYDEGQGSYEKPSSDIRYEKRHFKCRSLLYGVTLKNG